LRVLIALAASVPVLIGGVTWAATSTRSIHFRVTAAVSVQALGIDATAPQVGEPVTAGAKVVAERETTFKYVRFAVRDQAGKRVDFPATAQWTLGTTQKVYTATRTFARPGKYTYWFAYKLGDRWTNVGPKATFTVGGPAGTPTPTPTASGPATTPTPSPTGSSPATPPAPSPTGTATATSPAPSPTQTSTPRPVGTSTVGCRATPSACGYPDGTNTGVPPGTTLTPRAGGEITVAGTVIDRRDVSGCLTIRAANVVIRNSRIRCSSWGVIYSHEGGSVLVEDSELDCLNTRHGGLDGSNITARRVEIRGCENGIPAHNNVTVEDSWVHDLVPTSVEGAHSDGAQLFGGSNIVLRHNTILVPGANAAITRHVSQFTPSILIQNNFLGGGTYTIYCPYGGGSFRVEGNRFADGMQQYGLSLSCGGVTWSGNYRDSNGATVSP
jgi:Right handed beta helix region